MHTTRQFAEFVHQINFADVGKEVIEKAKLSFIDTIGCCIGGYGTDIAKILLNVFGPMGGKEESTVLGGGEKFPCMHAAFVNANLSMILDLDDVWHLGSIGIAHPAQSTIPTALAVGEKVGASTKDIITAAIVGYEMDVRFAKAIEPRQDSVYSYGTHQALGATITAAKLLELNQEEICHALGIAAAHAPVPSTMDMWCFKAEQRPASWVRDAAGGCALVGVQSALLAKEGFRGCPRVLDKEVGFWKLAGSDHYEEEEIIKNLGNNYAIETPTLKLYPSCFFNHGALEGVR